MQIRNVHERVLPVPLPRASPMIDRLGGAEDLFWPREKWPPMILDKPVGVGAAGGHAFIRYAVEAYDPGKSVVFRFRAPRGFDGVHRFDLEPAPGGARLRHTIAMEARGSALLKWLLLIRPMHDALIEDGFFRAERVLGLSAQEPRWPAAVRLMRRVARVTRRARFGPRAGRPEGPAP